MYKPFTERDVFSQPLEKSAKAVEKTKVARANYILFNSLRDLLPTASSIPLLGVEVLLRLLFGLRRIPLPQKNRILAYLTRSIFTVRVYLARYAKKPQRQAARYIDFAAVTHTGNARSVARIGTMRTHSSYLRRALTGGGRLVVSSPPSHGAGWLDFIQLGDHGQTT